MIKINLDHHKDLRTVAAALLVGVIWGSTNPFIRRGSLAVEQAQQQQQLQGHSKRWATWISPYIIVPWVINQLGSLLFVVLLGQADISMAVPVANAISIAANALVDTLLGEQYKLGLLLPGCLLVGAGVLLCTL